MAAVLANWVDYSQQPPLRGYIVVGPVGAVCAYVGIPLGSKLDGVHYDDVDLDVPGGLTFSSAGDNGSFPAGWYWLGWDYGHHDNVLWNPLNAGGMAFRRPPTEEVRTHVEAAMAQVRALLEAD